MRALVVAALLAAACSKSTDEKDKEIARLKAQLAKQTGAPATRGNDTEPLPDLPPPTAPKPEPVFDESKATVDNPNLGADAPGEMTGAWLTALIAQADQNKGITYAHLKKNADKYDGKVWSFSGRILEIGEGDRNGVTFTTARVALDYYGNQVMFVIAPFGTDFVEGKAVDIAGYLSGSYNYTSQAGWNITIPSIAARSIVPYRTFGKLRAAQKTGRGR